MNNDLISRQQAIAMCRKPCMRNADCSDFEMEIMMLPSAQPDTYWKEQCQSYERTINKLRESLSTQPEIIRCKDCKYWDTTWQNDYAPNYHYCPMIDGTHRNDFYCAHAEPKEEYEDSEDETD